MALHNLNIVLTDDDEDDRMLFKEAIEELKIKTKLSLFSDGRELMDFLQLPHIVLPHIIFLDLNMPVKDGLQCLREIRQNKTLDGVSVVIYSTSSSERDIEETFLNGANVYLNKPNNYRKLREVLEKVLKINWQYQTSNLNRDNFLLKL